MSLYLEQIRQLVALQHVDDGIHAVHAELEAAPKEVEALEKRFLAQDSQRNWILEKVQHLQEQQKRLDADIEAFDPVGMDTVKAWGSEKLYRIHLSTRQDSLDLSFTVRVE